MVYKQQEKALELLKLWADSDKQLFVLSGYSGTGKEQPISEPVLTPKGWVNIGDIKVDDLVIGSSGLPIQVTAIHPQGIKDVYTVTFSDNSTVRCGVDHLWTVQDGYKKWKTVPLSWMIDNYLRDGNSNFYRLKVAAYTGTQNGINVDFAYALGYMLGNGCFSQPQLMISCHLNVVDNVEAALFQSLGSPTNVRSNSPNGSQLAYTWKTIDLNLQAYKNSGYSEDKKLLDCHQWLSWNYESRLELLRGLLDSDGRLGEHDGKRRGVKQKLRFSSTSVDLIIVVRDLARSLGGRCCEPSTEARSAKYKSGYCGVLSFRMPVNPFKIRTGWIESEFDMSTKIIEIKKESYQENSVCITVDAEDHLYATNNFKLTHNSYLTRQFLEWSRETFPNHSVAVLAPSHKAVKNIQNILTGLVEATTISSFLGLTPQIDQTTGVLKFGTSDNQNCSTNPGDFELVIVDEFSMINEATVIDLNNQCSKVLYLGDPAQLPPIGEDNSIVPNLNATNYQLTDVVRYSGDLARIAHSWRKDTAVNCGNSSTVTLKSISKPIPITTTPDKTILELSKIKWITQYCCAVTAGNNVQLLTFTNKACDKWNSFVRSEIWEGNEPYCVGDKLIAKSPLFRSTSKNRLETAFNNSSEFTVSGDYQTCNMQLFNIWYPYYSIPVTTESGQKTDLFILEAVGKHQQQTELDRLKNEALGARINSHRGALWGRWHQLKKTFDDVAFAYAITTHKAQGSTYDAVYLDLSDISKCRDIERITYTALTRSKQAYTYI